MHRHNDTSFIVVAFYTLATPYEDDVKLLEADCLRLNLTFKSIGYISTGSWVRNAGIKPQFLKTMLAEYPGKNILYVDADARIRQYPKLFDVFDGDVGVHYRRGIELLSGTIFLRNNNIVRQVVDAWALLQQQAPRTWDQKTLQTVLASAKDVRIVNIPASYTQIFDTMAHHGEPIIEHFQASRRYKKVVERTSVRHPQVIGKVRLREGVDGSIYITRYDATAIAWLDKNAYRLQGQLRWIPIFKERLEIETLRPQFEGKTCYIVGKGPSLDWLSAEIFGDGIIIALNEAIYAVEKLGLNNQVFGLQQDASLRNTCYPEKGSLFVSVKAANFYADREDVYVFNSRNYLLSLNSLSVSAAIEIAKSLGVKQFVLVCFDACVTGDLNYANCIGYKATWGGRLERFKSHRAKIEMRTRGYPLRWVIPTDPSVTSSDTPQQ